MDSQNPSIKPATYRKRRLALGLAAVLLLVLLGGWWIAGRYHRPKPVTKRQTIAAVLSTKPTLLEVSGSGPEKTQIFKPSGDWIANWSYDCSKLNSSPSFKADVFLSGGAPSYGSQPMMGYGLNGSGSYTYHQRTQLYLNITSNCNWKVQVKG